MWRDGYQLTDATKSIIYNQNKHDSEISTQKIVTQGSTEESTTKGSFYIAEDDTSRITHDGENCLDCVRTSETESWEDGDASNKKERIRILEEAIVRKEKGEQQEMSCLKFT